MPTILRARPVAMPQLGDPITAGEVHVSDHGFHGTETPSFGLFADARVASRARAPSEEGPTTPHPLATPGGVEGVRMRGPRPVFGTPDFPWQSPLALGVAQQLPAEGDDDQVDDGPDPSAIPNTLFQCTRPSWLEIDPEVQRIPPPSTLDIPQARFPLPPPFAAPFAPRTWSKPHDLTTPLVTRFGTKSRARPKPKTAKLSEEDSCCVCFDQFEDEHPNATMACGHPLCNVCARRICLNALAQKSIAQCPICRCCMTDMQEDMVDELRDKGAMWMLISCDQDADIDTMFDLEDLILGTTRPNSRSSSVSSRSA